MHDCSSSHVHVSEGNVALINRSSSCSNSSHPVARHAYIEGSSRSATGDAMAWTRPTDIERLQRASLETFSLPWHVIPRFSFLERKIVEMPIPSCCVFFSIYDSFRVETVRRRPCSIVRHVAAKVDEIDDDTRRDVRHGTSQRRRAFSKPLLFRGNGDARGGGPRRRPLRT